MICLEFRGVVLGEFEVDVVVCEVVVDFGVGVEFVVNIIMFFFVKDDFEEFVVVFFGVDVFVNDFDGVGEVGKDGVVDSGECVGMGMFLFLGVVRVGRVFGVGEDMV